MSEQQSTEPKTVVKKTPLELAIANATKIFNSGINEGKKIASKQSKDPLRKRLGVIVNTVAGRKEKGTIPTFKQIKTAFNSLDDDRDNYIKAKGLVEKSMLYLASLPVPEKKPKGEQPNPSTI
jgi:hypothetical protein